MRIRNADGGEVEACGNGNALRRRADHGRNRPGALHGRNPGRPASRRRPRGRWRLRTGEIAVDMGELRTAWQDIPLAQGDGHASSRPCMRSAQRPVLAVAVSYRQPARGLLRRRRRGRRSRRPRPDCSSTTPCFRSAPISASLHRLRARIGCGFEGLGAWRRPDQGLRHRLPVPPRASPHRRRELDGPRGGGRAGRRRACIWNGARTATC